MDLRIFVIAAWLMMDVAAAPVAARKLLYKTSTTDGNKSTKDEVAYLDSATDTLQVYGRYTFVAPSGLVATVYYYADKDGYRAKTLLEASRPPVSAASAVGPLAGGAEGIGGEAEKGGYETELLPPEVLKSLLG